MFDRHIDRHIEIIIDEEVLDTAVQQPLKISRHAQERLVYT